jgi:hypothetical protein
MKQEPIMEIKFSQPFPLVRFENRSQKKESEACNSLIPSKPKACTSRCVNRFTLQGRAFSVLENIREGFNEFNPFGKPFIQRFYFEDNSNIHDF